MNGTIVQLGLPMRRHSSWRGTAGFALAILVSSLWVYHGLYNKLLDGEPRHLSIVRSVPGFQSDPAARTALAVIGIGEVALGAWVLAGWKPRGCAAVQTAVLLSMNAAELIWAREHLLAPSWLVPVNLLFLSLAWFAALLRFTALRRTGGYHFARMIPLHVLRRHPLRVRAHFDDCLVLTYAFPPAVLAPLLPPGLELDTHRGMGFVAIALVQTRGLRPRALPASMGHDFFLAGYRIFARFRTPDGRTLRGLRILRSDTDRRLMACAGNLLTHYNYQLSRVTTRREKNLIDIQIDSHDGAADLRVEADLAAPAPLPPGSPFHSIAEARRFAGPLPYTFDYEPQTHSIVVIKGLRQNWQPRLVPVTVRESTLFGCEPFAQAPPILAAAFHVSDIAYEWQRGIRYALREDVR